MKNLFLLVSFAFSSCHPVMAYTRKRAEPLPSPTPIVAATVSPSPSVLPFPKQYTYVCKYCTDAEKKTVLAVEDLIQKFIVSKCFEDAWHSFKRIEQSNGLDANGIIKKVRESSVVNTPLIFYWPTWRQSKNVIGYTYEGSPEIYLNRLFREDHKWTVWSEASNTFHETLHKIGFDHDAKATARRPYSVPYLGNRAVEFCEGKI